MNWKKSPEEHTALILAAREGHLDCIECLIGFGAEVNFVNKEQLSALKYAEKNGHQRCVDYLITRGATG